MPSTNPALWQPGQSGNPAGANRDQQKRFQRALLHDINQAYNSPDAKTRLAAVARALTNAAIGGDIQAIREVANRIDGPLPIPYQGLPNGAAAGAASTTPVVLVVKWGAPRQPEAEDLPMLELKATPVEAKR